MIKTSQQMPTTLAPAGAGFGMPGAMATPGTMPMSSEQSDARKYQALTSPEDIFKDYDVTKALGAEKSTDDIVQEIWHNYGGDVHGIDAEDGKLGSWPEDAPENMSQEAIDKQFDLTDDNRWKRLEKGATILDIFENGQDEIKERITGYITSLGLTKKPQTASLNSWYKLASNGSINSNKYF